MYKADREWKILLPERKQVILLKYLCEKFSNIIVGDVSSFYDMLKKYGTGDKYNRKLQKNYKLDSKIDIIKTVFFETFDSELSKNISNELLTVKSKIKPSCIVTEKEVYLLRDICETTSRISAGQIGSIHDFLSNYMWNGETFKSIEIKTKWDNDWKFFETQIRVIYFPHLEAGSSYGVGGNEKHKDSDRAWDLYQVFRRPIHLKHLERRSAESEFYHSPCTHCNVPIKFSDCELATLEEIKKGEN